MKIEIWSDYVCPFCYIGKRQLDEALKQFPHRDEVEVHYKSYELRPDISKNTGQSMAEMLAAKFNITVAEANNRLDAITARAAQNNLEFNFEKMIPTNTFNAHRLTKFAKTKGKEADITEALLKAYFTNSEHIGEDDTLVKLAESVGLNRQEVEEVLGDDQAFATEVRAEQAEAKQLGINGVPHFLVDGKHAIAGSQSVEIFLDYLNKFWAERSSNDAGETVTGDGCVDGACDIPEK